MRGELDAPAEPMLPGAKDRIQVSAHTTAHCMLCYDFQYSGTYEYATVIASSECGCGSSSRVGFDRAASAGHVNTKETCCENAAGKVLNYVCPSQVPPQLSGADELLDIPLDEDCLQRLLSGDSPQDDDDDDVKAKVGPLPFNSLCANWRRIGDRIISADLAGRMLCIETIG